MFQQCKSKDLWKTKSVKYIQVLTRSLVTVLGTLCLLMKMASSYFQRYLVGYRDEHFVGYEDYIYFRCITKTIVVFSDFCELEIEQPNCSQN